MPESLRIEIFPADLERALDFYARLGFELTGRTAGPPAYASLRLGEVRLGMCEAEPVDPARRALPAGTEIVIEVDDIRASRDATRAQGLALDVKGQ